MWTKSGNGETVCPPPVEHSGDKVILRRNFYIVPATDDFPAHYEWEEWQMTAKQYEIYRNFETALNERDDALIELAELFAEQDDALVELAEMIGG